MFLINILLLLNPIAQASELIVWNVGQGQWVSEVEADHCLHFDMGGEISPLQNVLKNCSGKKNYLSVSHLDWDHISFIKNYSSKVAHLCLTQRPLDQTHARFRQEVLNKLKSCEQKDLPAEFSLLYPGKKTSQANDSSAVVYSKKFKAIAPGDSPKKNDLWWNEKAEGARVLILGHHGSRTSTAKQTLASHPKIEMAIVSARKAKYGHPHLETVLLLKQFGIPLLKTEDWGNIHFKMN